MLSTKYLLSIICLEYAILIADALKCWECTSMQSFFHPQATEHCGESIYPWGLHQFARTNNILVMTECNVPPGGNETHPNVESYCETLVIKDEQNDSTSITRTCRFATQQECDSSHRLRDLTTQCIRCTTDFCNSSLTMWEAASTALMIFLALLYHSCTTF